MERIVCTCKNCGCTWGKLVNLWIQVGKGYIGPTIQNDQTSRLDIVATGEVRLGEEQTLVDKWYGFVASPPPVHGIADRPCSQLPSRCCLQAMPDHCWSEM